MSEEFTRPNGKRYRPRKPGLDAKPWRDDYDGATGLIVIGTLDVEVARPRAEAIAKIWYGTNTLTNPSPGWFRNGYRSGEHRWFIDCEKGRPGVSFEAVDQ